MAFILAAIVSLYVAGRQSFTMGTASADVHRSARIGMDWMAKEIKSAAQVETSRTISGTTYTSGANVLVLKVPSIDASKDVIDSDSDGNPDYYDYIVYHLKATDLTKLERIVGADSQSYRPSDTRTIASDINSLTFGYLDAGGSTVTPANATKVTISVVTRKTFFSDRASQETLSSEVKLRNKQ
jgi:Tfp pilus assembly protein PilW